MLLVVMWPSFAFRRLHPMPFDAPSYDRLCESRVKWV